MFYPAPRPMIVPVIRKARSVDQASGIDDPELPTVCEALSRAKSGKGRVKLRLSVENGTSEVKIHLPGRFVIAA